MATATKSGNKTDFVKEFLRENPLGNVKAVNEAWTAAGMPGTIGGTLINKMRSEMGLTGNLRATSTPKAVTKAEPVAETSTAPGKTLFVKEFLIDNPKGNVTAVNEAWSSAGFGGSISTTLVNKMRAKLGLVGNLRRRNKKSKTTAAVKKPQTSRVKGVPAVSSGNGLATQWSG